MQGENDTVLSRQLIERAQAGDDQSFDRIVRMTRSRLEALIHVRLGPRLRQFVEVDDVLQETYLRAFQSLAGFEYRTPWGVVHWLERICDHVLGQLARHFSRQKRLGRAAAPAASARDRAEFDPGRLLAEFPGSMTSPSKILRRNERCDRLEEALGSLSKDHREVIILARIQRLPIHEIAARMERSETATSMLLLRAVRKLREAFGETESWNVPLERLDTLGLTGLKRDSHTAPDESSSASGARAAEDEA